MKYKCSLFVIFLLFVFSNATYTNPNNKVDQKIIDTQPSASPFIIPAPPSLHAKAYLLIDVNSGKIIADKNSEVKLPPASLTKMMTLYVVSKALNEKRIHLNDQVRISRQAWKTGGSRMFVKEGQLVSVEDLLKGIIVDSGNDACAAIAEYVGGSEKGFTEMMNYEAKILGMKNSNFTDSTGLPNAQHYTTAYDLAILGRAIINHYPEYYHWYKQKWFTFNGIRQPNRNQLLWRDNDVDGLKTGHTDEAGYCLVSSAKKNNMRLLGVVLGAANEAARADDSERLLNYGFRFFETHTLFKKGQNISELDVYKGLSNKLPVGIQADEIITIPNGQYRRLGIKSVLPKALVAPILKDDMVGELIITFDNVPIGKQPLYALTTIKKGNVLKQLKDSIKISLNNWTNNS